MKTGKKRIPAIKAICSTCPHLDVARDVRGWPRKGAVGACRLREVPVERLEQTGCANHPDENFLGFQHPVGAVWVDGLPSVQEGFPFREDAGGGQCRGCGEPASGPGRVVWVRDRTRRVFCSELHYLEWAANRDPSISRSSEIGPEERADLIRFYRMLCRTEEAFRDGRLLEEDLLGQSIRHSSGVLFRYLAGRGLLPFRSIEEAWQDLIDAPPAGRQRERAPKQRENQLAIRELLVDPPDALPRDGIRRAFDLVRIRWIRMVLGELLDMEEGPEVPALVDRRFRGRYRPRWTGNDLPDSAACRRRFLVARNPDREKELISWFRLEHPAFPN